MVELGVSQWARYFIRRYSYMHNDKNAESSWDNHTNTEINPFQIDTVGIYINYRLPYTEFYFIKK